MKTCPHCKKSVPGYSDYCMHCGKMLHSQANQNTASSNLIPCPKCSVPVSPDARACPSCGHDVGAKDRNFWWMIALILFMLAVLVGRYFDYQTNLTLGR